VQSNLARGQITHHLVLSPFTTTNAFLSCMCYGRHFRLWLAQCTHL